MKLADDLRAECYCVVGDEPCIIEAAANKLEEMEELLKSIYHNLMFDFDAWDSWDGGEECKKKLAAICYEED